MLQPGYNLPMFSVVALLASMPGVDDPKPAAKDTQPRFELSAPVPTLPGVMIDRLTTGYGFAQETAKAKNLQARILWIDATANIDRYNAEDKIIALVKQIKDSGFNTVVFDVKPISGQTVYPSRIAPRLTEWRGKKLPEDFDPVGPMVRECKYNGLTIFASLNAFSEGHRMFGVGPGYNRPLLQTTLYDPTPIIRVGDATRTISPAIDRYQESLVSVFSAWDKVPNGVGAFAVVLGRDLRVVSTHDLNKVGKPTTPLVRGTTLLAASGASADFLRSQALPGVLVTFDTVAEFVPISQRPEQQIPLMMNPNHPDVQQYAVDIVREFVGKYEVDGIIYDDRLRYGGLNADFSQITRNQFEDFIKKTVKWPEDVFKFTINPNMVRGVQPGPLYDTWMAWRAKKLNDFVQRIRNATKAIRPGAQFGAYTGSWYGDYPALGHNYASPTTQAGFWFLSPEFAKTGTAPLLDFLVTGCYYPTATIHEAMSKGIGIGNTVESSATLVNRLVRDETWTYAGLELSDFKDDPDGLGNALQAALASSQGVMVFDLSHDIEPMWSVFRKAFEPSVVAPHAVKGLLDEVRSKRRRHDFMHPQDTPVIIAAGSSGTGQ